MKRILVLVVALGVMWVLQGISLPPTEGGTDPLILAAIGFVVLAAFTVGELGGRIGLPKVTGYIAAGITLGPQLGNVLSEAVVDDLKIFNTLALGLIATTAGLELDLKAIRRVWRTLVAVVIAKIPLLLLLVGGTFVALETFMPSLGLAPEAVLPVALILAVLGIGTSPAIALAVVNDAKSKGRLTDLLLAIAVVKDLVVVVSLAIALAIAKVMLSEGGELDGQVLVHVAEELGASIAVGSLLGGAFVAYVHYIHKHMLLFVTVTVLVMAELSGLLHLELLLVFIMAGFVVRNFSPYEHELLHPLERIALPVFVVFFATAGAALDLRGTLALLPLALALVVARVIAYWIAGRVGGALGGEPAKTRDPGWLTWIPQAGVTLGLVLLAADALPELSAELLAIGTALVAINLLVGPVTMGIGLRQAGETGAAGPTDAHAQGPATDPAVVHALDAVGAPTQDAHAAADLPLPTPVAPAQLLGSLTGIPAHAAVQALAQEIDQQTQRFFAEVAGPALDQARARAKNAILPSESRLPEAEAIDWAAAVDVLYQGWAGQVQALPRTLPTGRIEAPAAHQERQSTSSALARLGGASGRVRHLWVRRQLPLRMWSRVCLEPPMAAQAAVISQTLHQLEAQLHQLGEPATRTRLAPELCIQLMDEARDLGLAEAERTTRLAIQEALSGLVQTIEEAASPVGRPTAPQYSSVEPQVVASLQTLRADGPRWRAAVHAAANTTRMWAGLSRTGAQLQSVLDTRAGDPLHAMESAILGRYDAVIGRMQQVADELHHPDLPTPGDWQRRLSPRFAAQVESMVRRAASQFRRDTQPQDLLEALQAAVADIPETLQVVDGTPVSAAANARAIQTPELPLAERVHQLVHDELNSQVDRTLHDLVPHLGAAPSLLREGVEVARYGLSHPLPVGPDGAAVSEQDALDHAIEPLQRALSRVRADRDELQAQINEAAQRIHELEALVISRLEAATHADASGVARVQSSVGAGLRRVLALGQRLPLVVRSARHAMERAGQRAMAHPAVIERTIRTGQRPVPPQEMREMLRRAQGDTHLPTLVRGLFSERPLDDRRLFVAHTGVLQELARLEVQTASTTPMLALVHGARGSGRSSLMHQLQLRARSLRVIRPDVELHDRAAGPVGALAAELRVDGQVQTLADALGERPTLVLVDDVERLLPHGAAAVPAMDALLGLAAQTAGPVRWVVSIEEELLHRLEEVMPVAAIFHQEVHLGPVDWRTLREVAEVRARLGGLRLSFPRGGRLDILAGIEAADRFYRDLHRASGGNLSAAMLIMRRALHPDEPGLLRVAHPTAINLPFIPQLHPLGRALLAQLYLHGTSDVCDLALGLGMTESALYRQASALGATGLVDFETAGEDHMALPAALVHPIWTELAPARPLPGGTR